MAASRSTPRLAWRVELGGLNPRETFIDAHSGALLASAELTKTAYELDLLTGS